MLKSGKALTIVISILMTIAALAPPSVSAQDGRWVQCSRSGLGSGTPMYARGDGLLVFSYTNAEKFVIFDIQSGEWQEINLGAAQVFKQVETEGNVIFAYTDNLVFGYSALTMTWDTVTYSGDYVAGLLYYYATGRNLACFLTKSYLYVFDAELGNWQAYDYGLQPDQTPSTPWVKDDYIGLVLSNSTTGQPANVVYSLHTHSFNQTETGAFKSSPPMDHGFFGSFNVGSDGKTYVLTGYSALSNTFSYVNYTCGEDEAVGSGASPGTIQADEFTAFAYTFRYVVPNTSVTANWYGYDTRRGLWDHLEYNFDWSEDTYYGCWYRCGNFAFDNSLYSSDGSYHLFFYDGTNGIFKDYSPGIVYKSTTSACGGGGTVFCTFDTLDAWGYNIVDNSNMPIDLALHKTTNFYRGEDFATISRWSDASDTMITYFYNANTNNWSWAAVPEHYNQEGLYNGHMFLWCNGTDYEAIFYSSYLDQIYEHDFEDGVSVSKQVRGSLAYVKSANETVVFDGLTGDVFDFDFEINALDLGTNSVTFFDTTSRMLYGYSTLSQSWTTNVIDMRPYYCLDTGYIGLVSRTNGVVSYSGFYAYNGLADSWVELIPSGTHVGFLLGERTALVVRSTDIYAFDPQRVSVGVADDNRTLLPSHCELGQNYPNPFNPSTVIEYTLPRREQVELSVYNLLGRKVITLLDKIQDPGKHEVTWDGRDENGILVGSGLYFYQIKSGGYSTAKKMLMLK